MTPIKLHCTQESQAGKQELVWAIWRRYFQFPLEQSEGLLASTFENQADNPNISQLCFEFTDRRLLDNFESSVAFNNYIWEVLPLLTHKFTISYAESKVDGQAAAHVPGAFTASAHGLRHGLNDMFSLMHRTSK